MYHTCFKGSFVKLLKLSVKLQFQIDWKRKLIQYFYLPARQRVTPTWHIQYKCAQMSRIAVPHEPHWCRSIGSDMITLSLRKRFLKRGGGGAQTGAGMGHAALPAQYVRSGPGYRVTSESAVPSFIV